MTPPTQRSLQSSSQTPTSQPKLGTTLYEHLTKNRPKQLEDETGGYGRTQVYIDDLEPTELRMAYFDGIVRCANCIMRDEAPLLVLDVGYVAQLEDGYSTRPNVCQCTRRMCPNNCRNNRTEHPIQA